MSNWTNAVGHTCCMIEIRPESINCEGYLSTYDYRLKK